ncbi:MAG TPA: hypothetical protein VHE34_09530 [Puia sp.]|uniref:hypothetical protein n=1 Tax=Puia sp. TaxID=2045100 RepID=UPI002C73F844|nr:hypothetical protein [Puia sp.]HVU95455.1 hypothetical protein [Puia sp.]
MNTETLNALKQVNGQINQLHDELRDPSLPQGEIGPIEDAIDALEAMRDILIHEALQSMVDQLNQTNARLQAVLTRMQGVSDRLDRISAAIRKVSDVISALVQITQKAMSAGLLG